MKRLGFLGISGRDVRKDIGMPGDGYFKGACRFGQFDPDGHKDKRSFWTEELERVHDHWSDH